MADLICTRKLTESRGVTPFCQCFNCRAETEKDQEWESALEYYRGPQPEEAMYIDPFPKKGKAK